MSDCMASELVESGLTARYTYFSCFTVLSIRWQQTVMISADRYLATKFRIRVATEIVLKTILSALAYIWGN